VEYVVLYHPLIGSKFEDIVDEQEKTIKYEVLLSKAILKDKKLFEYIFEDIQDMYLYLASPLIENNNAPVLLTFQHLKNIETHKKINNNKTKVYTINISNLELNDTLFIKQMISNNKSHYIELELLEYKINLQSLMIKKHIEELKKATYNFILDDYGVGYSNYNRIKSLNLLSEDMIRKSNTKSYIDTIKIDGSLLSSIMFNNNFTDEIKKISSEIEMKELNVHLFNFLNRLNSNREGKKIKFKAPQENKEEIMSSIKYLRKKETELEANNQIRNICEEMHEVINHINNNSINIVIEYVNLKSIKNFITKFFKKHGFQGNIYFQGFYIGERTKNIHKN